MSSPGSRLLKKINTISSRTKPFKVTILGQNGVGKTAFTVRFCTRRYIGDYDPILERVYTCQRMIQDTHVDFEAWDTAGINENSRLKEHIRWADAIILMYDVTDRCSFNECTRLKFLVNSFCKRSRWKTISDSNYDSIGGIPVALVGNKADRDKDRMVLLTEGATRSEQLKCVSFTEVSVQEDVDAVISVFENLYLIYRTMRKFHVGMSVSKTSLTEDKHGSSSDDDINEDLAGGGMRTLRRGTSPGQTETLAQTDLSQRSRRRHAIYTMS
uniref:small monomeric GTPase n=2 Tax=Arion vulgaris TaxID=1028688 RepID=A0A0B7B1F2_9EUPU